VYRICWFVVWISLSERYTRIFLSPHDQVKANKSDGPNTKHAPYNTSNNFSCLVAASVRRRTGLGRARWYLAPGNESVPGQDKRHSLGTVWRCTGQNVKLQLTVEPGFGLSVLVARTEVTDIDETDATLARDAETRDCEMLESLSTDTDD